MSIGTFADRASREHVKQTTRQKKIVFGERPMKIISNTIKGQKKQAQLNPEEAA